MAQLKPIWIGKNDADILKYADSIENFSGRIKQMIRNDIERQRTGVDPELRDLVEMLIETKLAGRMVAVSQGNDAAEVMDLSQFY